MRGTWYETCNIKLHEETDEVDKAWWMSTSSGKFTVKSAWKDLKPKKRLTNTGEN